MRGISRPAENLSASQEGLCFMELFAVVTKFKKCVNEHMMMMMMMMMTTTIIISDHL